AGAEGQAVAEDEAARELQRRNTAGTGVEELRRADRAAAAQRQRIGRGDGDEARRIEPSRNIDRPAGLAGEIEAAEVGDVGEAGIGGADKGESGQPAERRRAFRGAA